MLPKFDELFTITVSGSIGAFEVSQHRELALDFLRDLNDPSLVPLYSAGLWMPALEAYYTDEDLIASWIDNDVHPSNYRTAVMEPTLNNGINYPAFETKNFSAIEASIAGSLGAIFTDPVDVEDAAKRIAEQVNPLMQGVYDFA